MAYSLRRIWNLEFESGIRSLVNGYKDKRIRMRYLLDAFVVISRILVRNLRHKAKLGQTSTTG